MTLTPFILMLMFHPEPAIWPDLSCVSEDCTRQHMRAVCCLTVVHLVTIAVLELAMDTAHGSSLLNSAHTPCDAGALPHRLLQCFVFLVVLSKKAACLIHRHPLHIAVMCKGYAMLIPPSLILVSAKLQDAAVQWQEALQRKPCEAEQGLTVMFCC